MILKNPEFSLIKNIIFDLGGVLLNIDYSLTEYAFSKLGISDFSEIYSQAKQSTLFDDFETGKLSPEDFRTRLRKYLNKYLSNSEIDNAWNAMLLNLPAHRLEMLRAVKSNYRTFLLSNTNKIHYDEYSKYLLANHSINDFKDVMEKQYLSFELGLRKPDETCFKTVLNENKLIPAETLFIDDSIQHIIGAKNVGILTHHLKANDDVSNLFT